VNMGKAASAGKRMLGRSEFKYGKLDLLGPLAQPPKCPECNSQRAWKDGVIKTKHGNVQRWLCRSCGHRFSDLKVKVDVVKQSSELSDSVLDFGDFNLVDISVDEVGLQDSAFAVGENICSHDFSIVEKGINNFSPNSKERQCMRHLDEGAKNLVEVEQQIKVLAGDTWKPETVVDLQRFALWLRSEGVKQSSIQTYTNCLTTLIKNGADLQNPKSVKSVLGQIPETRWKEGYKHTICDIYSKYLDFQGLKWKRPKYRDTNELIFIPTDMELQIAINCGSKENRIFTQFVYETGCRLNEAERLGWIDIDSEKRLVDIKKSKNGNPRRLKVSSELISMLLSLPKNHETVFTPKCRQTRGIMFHKRMQTLARKSSNPRFPKIHLHTFRHCKALREYHRTKDMLHVKYVLGHKTLRATQRYVELYEQVYGDLQPQDYIVKIVRTSEEAKQLLKVGFEYVNEIDGEYLYKKAKTY